MSFTEQPQAINPKLHFLLEQPLIQAPLEQLKMSFKSAQKHVERDMATVSSVIQSVCKSEPTYKQLEEKITWAIQRMEHLKSKLANIRMRQKSLIEISTKRMAAIIEVKSFKTINSEGYRNWEIQRLDRILIDYIIRSGLSDSAKRLAMEKDLYTMVDIDLYEASHVVKNGLLKKSSECCLAWCTEHKVHLKKSKSDLEVQVRMQDYIELIRKSKLHEAIRYAQKYLSVYIETNPELVLNAGALLAYSPKNPPTFYEHYFSEDRWQKLADKFIRTHNELYNIPSIPLLYTALAAGLVSLKLPACYKEKSDIGTPLNNSNKATTRFHQKLLACPVCDKRLNVIARDVPFAHALRSSIIDPLTGIKLGGTNEPLLLPNGKVYGSETLADWNKKAKITAGKVVDPISGEEFAENTLRRIYIL